MVRRIRRDVPTENSSIYTHGHLKKLDGVVTNYMSGIGTWEPISGAATTPAPPDKSVQFNDGLTAFGGSAFFLFDKTTGTASLGNTSTLDTAKALYISSNKTIGIYANGNGSTGGNQFRGYSAFGDAAADFGARILISDAENNASFNFRSLGATKRNLVAGKLEVRAHSAFGQSTGGTTDQTVASNIINVGDGFTGNLSSGPYGAVNTATDYTPSAGTPTIREIAARPNLVSGTINQIVAAALTSNVTDGNIGAIFGAFAIAQISAGNVTEHMIGLSGEINVLGGDISGADFVAGVQTTVGLAGGTNCPVAYGFYVAGVSGATNNYGVYVTEQVSTGYNIYSVYSGTPGNGKNFLGSGAQVGSTGTNISEYAGGILGIGTGATASVAGKLRCAGIGIGGNQSGSEELTVIGDASISVSLAVAGSISGSEKLTVTGDGSASGYWNAGSYKVGGAAGASGNFTTVDLKTVTVVNGIVTSIV